MKLKRLDLQHFRNYEALTIEFEEGLTILAGENAQGKTNLLEAIYLLSLAKSHRTNVDREMIQWDQDFAIIKGEVESKDFSFPLELQLTKKGKIAKFNHLEQGKLSRFIGKLNVILFAPEDMQLIKGSPALRRRFIDAELGQTHPLYLNDLLIYQQVLKQRNQYLRAYRQHKIKQLDQTYLSVLTDQLIEYGVKIIQARLIFIEKINHLAAQIHQELSNGRDHLKLAYQSSRLDLKEGKPKNLQTQLAAVFEEGLDREIDQGTSLYGPHRDDLLFYLNDKSAQGFASQGQQRTIILSLKLAEIEWMQEELGEYPILLLDDVLSELDPQRQLLLMNHIEGRVQTFLTTASIQGLALDQLSQTNLYYVNQGQITKGDGN